jgi:hypothetical protein
MAIQLLEDVMDFQFVFDAAMAAGDDAYNKAIPEPMTVTDGARASTFREGVCGFAGSTPRQHAIRQVAEKNGLAGPGYPKGLNLRPPYMTQSYDRKMASGLRGGAGPSKMPESHHADGRLD